ncbi:MAG TPA: hypothetical protein VGO80_15160 [Solirubrobacteraceae bacterium]|nr:hypothetical protein [Solirubrobacteraceae bacterium]
MPEDKKGVTARTLGAVGVAITVVAGATALLFEFQPDLKPCIGGHEAHFTGAPVFPGADYKDYLRNKPDRGSDSEIEDEPDQQGAEVRLSYSAKGLRHKTLKLTYSLVSIRPDDTLGPVDPDRDRLPGPTVSPDTCDEVVGRDIFTPVDHGRKRYRVVLELFREGSQGDERLALTQTAIFTP